MPVDATHSDRALALLDLSCQLTFLGRFDSEACREMTPDEQLEFQRKHPGAHFVIGDFEIRCLKPEKYGLPSACDEFNARMETKLAEHRAAMKALML